MSQIVTKIPKVWLTRNKNDEGHCYKPHVYTQKLKNRIFHYLVNEHTIVNYFYTFINAVENTI